jgi:selenocysteine lyase/cysteine desulfurase
MDRRGFVAMGSLGLAELVRPHSPSGAQGIPTRGLFPRLRHETFLGGAGGTPLGAFADEGIQRYLDFIRLGPGEGRGDYRNEVWSGVRGGFARLIGAREDEVGLVECTKAGEQLAVEGVVALWRGGNVVTNDLHFSGSLHNYEGLRRAGLDVRIVRAGPGFVVPVDRMVAAMDQRTALVAVSLVSNVNGHIEPVAELSRAAHERGALLYADIIQAAGAIPVDVRAMGIDIAAASSYKWLFGIHGAGFLYVRRELQGTALHDRLFPGHVQRQYAPWVAQPPSDSGLSYVAPTSATRYQPGHVNYLGYAAAFEGMAFIEQVGGPVAIQRHATGLVARLLARLDRDRYEVITPEPDKAPILSLRVTDVRAIATRLAAARVVVGVGGDMAGLLRISPAIYNTEADIDLLAEVLGG